MYPEVSVTSTGWQEEVRRICRLSLTSCSVSVGEEWVGRTVRNELVDWVCVEEGQIERVVRFDGRRVEREQLFRAPAFQSEVEEADVVLLAERRQARRGQLGGE